MILRKFRQRMRWAARGMSFSMGLGRRHLQDRPGLRVLIYHGVVPDLPRPINARFVTVAQLDAHCAHLKRHHQVITLDEAFLGEYDPKRLAVALTFDDGYRNNLRHALPVLQRHGLPATIFVTAARALGQDILWADLLDCHAATAGGPLIVAGTTYRRNRKGEFVAPDGVRLKTHAKQGGPAFWAAMQAAIGEGNFRRDPRWNDFWQLLDAQELQELADAPGISIGGHGSLHQNLDLLPLDRALADVETGLAWIRRATGKAVTTFAYPDGAYSPALVQALPSLGIEQQYLDQFLHPLQPDAAHASLRSRFTVHPFLKTEVLMSEILRGSYL